MAEAACPRVSVVIATYDRAESLVRLLGELARQSLPPDQYEVVVVDDGSRVPVRPALEHLEVPYTLRIEEQPNAGAAAARQRGAKLARGEILVILDDDMSVGPGFLEAHLAAHPAGSRKAVLGVMRHTADFDRAPLYDRWHKTRLDEFYAAVRAGRTVRGWNLYTGNLSVRREDFAASGGFDPTLARSEDAELGMRLDRAGVAFEVCEDAWTLNAPDRRGVGRWRRGAELYGATDVRISRKHPELPDASPWRYFGAVNPLLPPMLVGTSLVPQLSHLLGTATYALGAGFARLGLERAAYVGVTLTYGIDYLRGARRELGSSLALLRDVARHLAGTAEVPGSSRRASAVRAFVEAVRADHERVLAYDEHYGIHKVSGRLAVDAVRRIGLQMMIWVRVMRLFRDAGLPLAAQATSRLIRHLYSADIHWDAEIAPGVVIAHGFGLGISRSSRIGPGCIICHNVSIGLQTTLEANVHVNPGAILVGAITVGEGSKIMPGAILRHSVPPRSLVVPAEAEVQQRDRAAAGAA